MLYILNYAHKVIMHNDESDIQNIPTSSMGVNARKQSIAAFAAKRIHQRNSIINSRKSFMINEGL